MKEWVVIVFYVVAVISYCVLHELIFKYRFKEVAFTLAFLAGIFFVAMLATGFNSLLTWLHICTLIIILAYAIYVSIIIRVMREKIQKKILGEFNVQEMINTIFKGDVSNNEEKKQDDNDIHVTEEEEWEERQEKNFDVGDIIIDEDKKDDKKDGDKK